MESFPQFPLNLPSPLSREFYNRPTLTVAREMLGQYLVRRVEGEILIGKIVETEAYAGEDDPASHAARGRTNRTELMFGPPGYAYIYFIYGMHYCLNAVTEREGFPAAVLIRAIEPLRGVEKMRRFRSNINFRQLTNGPGKLCRALGLDMRANGLDLCASELFVSPGEAVAPGEIAATSRIGIRVGKDRPWRFYIKNHPFVSHIKQR